MKKADYRELTLLVLLGLMLFQSGCARQGGGTNEKLDEPVVVENTEQTVALGQTEIKQVTPKINIFIENSASMNGFINNASGFQNAMLALTSKLKNRYGKDNLNLGFINANVVPQHGEDPYQLMNKMLVKSNFTSAGLTSTTDLNNLIKLVLGNTDENSLTFFVSDCIYSIKNDKSTTTTRLEGCQNGTMDVFQEKLKDFYDLSILFIRMVSNFNGGYWDYLHPSGKASQQLMDCNRPYFICVVGSDSNIKELNSKIRMEDLKGYGQQYYLSGKDYSNTFYTVVSKPYNSGAFSIENNFTIKQRRSSDIQFAIAINLDGFPMTEEEKSNMDNYVVEGDFNLVKIEPIGNNTLFSPNEKNNVVTNGCTHLLVVSSNGYPSDFSIKIKPTIAEWVNQFTSTNDTEISKDNEEELSKTFGISYFINGAAAAYERDSYFTMNIKIKH
jgi:hypothetical protein